MNLSSQGIKASIIFQALQGFRFPGDITSVEAETGDRIVFGVQFLLGLQKNLGQAGL